MNKCIGIIGSGQVGQALGNGFLKHGYQVMIGTREPEKLNDWKAAGGTNASVGSNVEAAGFGQIIVLAVKGEAALEALAMSGADNLNGKILIDTTNPIDHSKPPLNGLLSLFTGPNESLMESIQQAVPAANVVKAFNIVGNAFMVNPNFPQGKPTMFICGNNADAKREVTAILDKFGWITEDMGMVESARAIEPLVCLWCLPGMLRKQWNHAFALYKMNE
ncbi:MAG: NADPH-dependent F420 reductase [Flavobacteriales bacterium]